MQTEKGIRRSFWIPNGLDQLIETTSHKIGMSRSAFYRTAVLRYLENLSVLSSKAHEVSGEQTELSRRALN